MDFSGTLDIPDKILSRLEFVIASYHDIVITRQHRGRTRRGMINAQESIRRCESPIRGNPVFQVDIDRVVKAAQEYMEN